MGPAAYIIAILGCADGASGCQQVATVSSGFRTEAECLSARDAALDAHLHLDFPTIVADCVPASRPVATNRERRKASRA